MRRLLLRPGAIGDCLLAFPAMESLQATYTEVWVPTPIVPIIHFADQVCSIATTGLDLVGVGDLPTSPILRSRLESFDEIVSWYGAKRKEFRAAMKAVGVPCRFLQALPPNCCPMHATDFYCSQVGAAMGTISRIGTGRAAIARGTIVIHPFSGSVSKNWPLRFYRELAGRLDAPVEWSAGPEEALTEATRFDNLKDLGCWLSGARLYVGNDSGITHLAAAVGTPTLALFGDTSPAAWAPRGENVRVLRHQPLSELPVESVATLIGEILG